MNATLVIIPAFSFLRLITKTRDSIKLVINQIANIYKSFGHIHKACTYIRVCTKKSGGDESVGEEKSPEKSILQLFPIHMSYRWEFVARHASQIQEIRLRRGKPVVILTHAGECFLKADGTYTRQIDSAYRISGQELDEILNYMCNYSLYAFEDEIRKGFITMPGGHRVGVAGQAVLDEKEGVKTLKHISYMNIRVANQIRGISDVILSYLYCEGKIQNTLIISPPGCGKTTLLRELIRKVSDGNEYGEGVTVGVVDERSEIAGSFMGEEQNDVGMRTDVLDGCPKVCGMMMLIRAMSPKVIAVDELGGEEDYLALRRVAACGCGFLATVHGEGIEELLKKKEMKQILNQDLFNRYIILGKKQGKPYIKGVYGKEFKPCFELLERS